MRQEIGHIVQWLSLSGQVEVNKANALLTDQHIPMREVTVGKSQRCGRDLSLPAPQLVTDVGNLGGQLWMPVAQIRQVFLLPPPQLVKVADRAEPRCRQLE